MWRVFGDPWYSMSDINFAMHHWSSVTFDVLKITEALLFITGLWWPMMFLKWLHLCHAPWVSKDPLCAMNVWTLLVYGFRWTVFGGNLMGHIDKVMRNCCKWHCNLSKLNAKTMGVGNFWLKANTEINLTWKSDIFKASFCQCAHTISRYFAENDVLLFSAKHQSAYLIIITSVVEDVLIINAYWRRSIIRSNKCITKSDWLVDQDWANDQPVRELLFCMVWFALYSVSCCLFKTLVFQFSKFNGLCVDWHLGPSLSSARCHMVWNKMKPCVSGFCAVLKQCKTKYCCFWLSFVAYCPTNMLVYLGDGSAQTVVWAATMRLKLRHVYGLRQWDWSCISNFLSHPHCTDTRPTNPNTDAMMPGAGRVATGLPIFRSLVWLELEENSHWKQKSNTFAAHGRLNH